MNIKKFVTDFFREEEGLTMVEYAIAGGLIAAGLVVIFTDLGTAIGVKIQAIIDALG